MHLTEDEITKATRIIIIKLEQYGMIGVLVDEVIGVVTIDNTLVEKVTYDLEDDTEVFISGVGKLDDGLISLLDLNLVLREKDAEKENS